MNSIEVSEKEYCPLRCPKCLGEQHCPCESCTSRRTKDVTCWKIDEHGFEVTCGHCGLTDSADNWEDAEWDRSGHVRELQEKLRESLEREQMLRDALVSIASTDRPEFASFDYWMMSATHTACAEVLQNDTNIARAALEKIGVGK